MRWIAAFVLLAYSAVLVRLLVFKNVFLQIGSLRFRFGQEAGEANFLPFRTIASYLTGEHGRLIATINLIGNIALFVPIGFLASFALRELTRGRSVSVALGVAAGLVIEGMEVVFRTGVFDVDDVILNASGVVAGFRAFSLVARQKRPRSKSI